MEWNTETIVKVKDALCERAERDADFRALCLTDINAAVREISGAEVPAGTRISVVDGGAYDIAFILPPARALDRELLDAELDAVAGGNACKYCSW